MASKRSTPNIPRLDSVKVPAMQSANHGKKNSDMRKGYENLLLFHRLFLKEVSDHKDMINQITCIILLRLELLCPCLIN